MQGGLVNVIGTLDVFEAARDAGRPVRVTYASSSAVWGPEEAYASGKRTEDDPLKPATHYGVFKQAFPVLPAACVSEYLMTGDSPR